MVIFTCKAFAATMAMYYLISASAFFVFFVCFTGVSGVSAMEDSHSVVASRLTKDSVNSGYKNRDRLVGHVGQFAEQMGQACLKEDIEVNESPESPMPNGLPSYTVEVVNVCSTGCSIGKIHLACGSFTSAIEIDPKLFKRLSNNDCLVNNGKPIKAGGSVSFVYAQTYEYPLSVSSVKCVP